MANGLPEGQSVTVLRSDRQLAAQMNTLKQRTQFHIVGFDPATNQLEIQLDSPQTVSGKTTTRVKVQIVS